MCLHMVKRERPILYFILFKFCMSNEWGKKITCTGILNVQKLETVFPKLFAHNKTDSMNGTKTYYVSFRSVPSTKSKPTDLNPQCNIKFSIFNQQYIFC